MKPSVSRTPRGVRRFALACATAGLLVVPSTALATDGWSTPTQITASSTDPIAKVSCASASLCLATDADGNLDAYNGSMWSGTSAPHTLAFPYFVACPPGSSSCVALGAEGSEWQGFTYSGSTLSGPLAPVVATSKYPDFLTCTSSAFCVLLDSYGDTFSDSNGTWTEDHQVETGNHLVQVSCGSPTMCVAVAISGTTGTGGYAYTYNGSAWSAATTFDTVGQVSSVSCAPGSSFCVAVDLSGNVIIDSNGSWSAPVQIETPSTKYQYDGLEWVSCASTSFCVAVDGSGNAFTYNGGTWSAAAKIDSSTVATTGCVSGKQFCYGLAEVSCPSTTFCMAIDNNGDVLTLGGSPGAPLASAATGAHLSVKAGTPVSVVGVDAKAKPGTKVNAKLSGTESRSATLKVSATHSFTWSLGKLKAGSYTAKFTIAGKVVKTTTIKVTK